MPQIDPGSRNTNATKPRKVRVTAKAAPPVKARPVKVTVPDAGEATRTRTVARMTPDQADRERTPAQKTKDAAAVKTNVRVSREKAVAKAGRGSGTRAVKGWIKSNLSDAIDAKTSTKGVGGGSGKFAVFAANAPIMAGLSAKELVNASKDAGEILVTTPSSVAHLASTAVHHPKKLPGELAAPYVDFAKHPVKTASERPISTALMLAPGVRMPGRVVGKVARVTGKQTLERPAATLPHTALKETRTGSRDFTVRVMQSRKDAKGPAPTVTAKQVQQRVDHHYDASKQESHRTIGEAVKAADKATKGQPKDVRAAAVDLAREQAREKARLLAEERFAREFGAVDQVTPQGHVVTPKAATEGTLHDTRSAALKVASRLNTKTGTAPTDPMRFVVRKAGQDTAGNEQFAAVPKVATQRLVKHQKVGSSPATMAKVMRVSRGAFTNAVLPLSPKWLAGQGVEAGIRSAVAGAGPMDWLRMGKVVKELNKKSPGAGDQLATRISGGQFGLTGPARDFANGKSLADEFADTSLEKGAKAASAVGRTLPARAVKEGWKQYTRVVLDGINHTIESNARRAMAGQAIKNLGIQDSHLLGLTGKAIDDAASGLKGTHTQVALARAVDRMYGQYQKFSAEKRSLLLHWTPFLPWYLNTAKFLFRVLPMDHPVISALIADANMAEEEWRKSHGLSFHDAHVPFYMMGSYPTKDGKYRNIAHYTPWGVGADPVGASADLALPQILGPIKNMGGVDWKWQRLTHGGKHGPELNWGEKLARAGVTALEEQIPGVSQAGKISGITPRFIDKDNPDDIKSPGEAAKGYLPWTPMSNNQPTTGGASASSSSSGRIKVPGSAGGRIKVPGVTGRIKIP